ncbi:MAG: leucine-rich repeat protein [Agathobacter sp.]
MDIEVTGNGNTIITGIWDEENIKDYNYLVIPEPNVCVPTLDLRNGYPYKTVDTIGENAFSGNTYIKVYIPSNVKVIQTNAFFGCSSVEKVLFGGTQSEWERINVETGNEILKSVNIEYNANMPRLTD